MLGLQLRPSTRAWLWEKLEELPFLWSMVPIRSWVAAATRYVAFLLERLEGVGYDEKQIKETVTATLSGFSTATPLHCPGMACVSACLWVAGLELNPEALPLPSLQPNAVESLLQRRQAEMDRTINEHNTGDEADTREKWPSPQLPFSTEIHSHLDGLVLKRFRNEWAVLNAPAIAAAYAAYDIPPPENLILLLQQLRGVDPAWFDCAHQTALFVLCGKRLDQDSKCFSSDFVES